MASIKGVAGVERAIADMIAKVDGATREIVARVAADVETEVKKQFQGSHARNQGHEGGSSPNVVTGSLRRSVTVEPVRHRGPGIYATRVYPTMIYARRIELGFSGADSLGRVYDQPAFPFFGPGVRKALAKADETAGTHWAETLRK